MTRAGYKALADRVEREGVTREVNEAVALALGWEKYPGEREPWWSLPERFWQEEGVPEYTERPDFSDIQTVAEHTPDWWVLLTLGEFTGHWECELAKRTTVVGASAPTEAAARIAAILRAKGAEADALL